MKPTHESSESLKKVLDKSKPFDEAKYYQSQQVDLGGDDVLEDASKPDDDEDDDEEEDYEFYADD